MDGGEYSLRNSALSLMAQPNVSLKVLAMNPKRDLVLPNDKDNHFIAKASVEFVEVDTRIKPFRMFTNLFSKDSYLSERFNSEVFRAKLIEILKVNTFDIIQLEHLYLYHYINDIRLHSKAKIVLRAQNVEYKLWDTIIENNKNPVTNSYLKIAVKRLKRIEEHSAQLVDGLICLTEVDADIYKNSGVQTPISIVPIGFDFSAVDNVPIHVDDPKSIKVYHLGSMDWKPNLQGIHWFIDEVLPILSTLNPDIKIHLAGKKMPQAIYKKANKNIVVDGEVKDAFLYQNDKSVLIVPLLSGSGIRVKIIEAMALGKTVISTSIGAQGIGFTDKENILIADSPKGFAQAIQQCYISAELRNLLSKNAQELARNRFDLDKVGKQKISFYKTL